MSSAEDPIWYIDQEMSISIPHHFGILQKTPKFVRISRENCNKLVDDKYPNEVEELVLDKPNK